MSPGPLNRRILADRIDWIDRMIEEIRKLPLNDRDAFMADNRNIWAAESCLRRALEALLDLGRHILAKRFGKAVAEYKEIARALHKANVLNADLSATLETLAGYRNRMVHFYHEISNNELFEICTNGLPDILNVKAAFLGWIDTHQESLDDTL
jgi:uncharacterized protein YutE (UPF0331/DUF86 family)